jgi:hypothetical protein
MYPHCARSLIDGQPCRHGTARARLARLAAVPCLVVLSCRGCGTGTALRRRRRVVPCLAAREALSCWAEEGEEQASAEGSMPVGSVQREESGRRRPAQRRRGRRPTQRRRGRSCGRQGQELRAASAVGGRSSDVGGGGLRSGGEGRSCGGLRPLGGGAAASGAGVGSGGCWGGERRKWEERKKIRVFMFYGPWL